MLGFGVSGLRFEGVGFGFSLRFRVQGSGSRVQRSRCSVQDSGFKV